MSRHELPCRKGSEYQLVVGYDAELRLFYGQLFDHRDQTVAGGGPICIGGWPRIGGLGGTELPLHSEEEADVALDAVFAWLEPLHDLTRDKMDWLRRMLKREWAERQPRGHERFVWSNEIGYERL